MSGLCIMTTSDINIY